MNYTLIYDSIIDNAKSLNRDKCNFEKHHIVPKCIGGCDASGNLVLLTAREHYVCHQLLVKNHKLIYAANRMMQVNGVQLRSNRLYGWLREKLAKDKTGMKHTEKSNVCTATVTYRCQSSNFKEWSRKDNGSRRSLRGVKVAT